MLSYRLRKHETAAELDSPAAAQSMQQPAYSRDATVATVLSASASNLPRSVTH
jgi:hypothetical protein